VFQEQPQPAKKNSGAPTSVQTQRSNERGCHAQTGQRIFEKSVGESSSFSTTFKSNLVESDFFNSSKLGESMPFILTQK
jgi:hypothetical protein